MATQQATSVPSKRLATSILSTDLSFKLNNILSWAGIPDGVTNLTAADFGTRAFGVFRNSTNTQMELFEFDPSTIAATSITIISRGLNYRGGTTANAVTAYNWNANETIVELGSHTPQLFEQYMDKSSDETITGIKTFSSSPVVPTGGSGTQAANATDIANAVTGASGLATNLVNGTLKTSVAPAVPGSPIAVGDNDSRVPTANQTAALAGNNTDIAVGSGNKVVTQTGLQHGAEQYAADSSVSANTITITLAPVPTSYTAGMAIRTKVANAVTGATTINVNALGAKTVKKYVNKAISDLAANDILANQTVTMVYDSGLGFMILQSPITNLITVPVPNWVDEGSVSWAASSVDQTLTLTNGGKDLYMVVFNIDFTNTGVQNQFFMQFNGHGTSSGLYQNVLLNNNFGVSTSLSNSGSQDQFILANGPSSQAMSAVGILYIRGVNTTGLQAIQVSANIAINSLGSSQVLSFGTTLGMNENLSSIKFLVNGHAANGKAHAYSLNL